MMSAQSEKYGMGTVITNRVFGKCAEEALQAALKETGRLEGLLSRFLPGSEISRINRLAGTGYEKVSDETYEVLSGAAKFSGYCRGCFDITIGPLVDLWAEAKLKSSHPEESDIWSVLPLVNHTGLVLDPCNKTAGLKKEGQSIDLGGIGKGFAADKVLDVLRRYEIASAFTNFGGNVAVIGSKPDGSPWSIGIRHPREENTLIGAVSIVNKSVVTSGDYQRYFTGIDGKRYHHILDPRTGYPAESGLISATVVAGSSMTADALSTILFVRGIEDGIGMMDLFPGAEAILIDENMHVYVSNGLKDSFSVVEGVSATVLD